MITNWRLKRVHTNTIIQKYTHSKFGVSNWPRWMYFHRCFCGDVFGDWILIESLFISLGPFFQCFSCFTNCSCVIWHQCFRTKKIAMRTSELVFSLAQFSLCTHSQTHTFNNKRSKKKYRIIQWWRQILFWLKPFYTLDSIGSSEQN